MPARYLLGVDFGGGASKATLLSDGGAVIATSIREYPTYYPYDGWAEQDPQDCYTAFLYNVRQILSGSGIDPKDIAALSLDAATHTAVLLDEKDDVVRPSIYWTDKRNHKEADYLFKNHYDLILDTTYNAPTTLWTLPQLMWLREHEPDNFDRIAKIMFVKDYVRSRLTGDFVTDSIDAIGSMLMDIKNRCWSEDLCTLCGITTGMLPRIIDPCDIVGYIDEKAAKETGLSPATAIVAGATDTVMEVYASGVIHPGQATVKLATAGRICPVTPKPYPHPLLFNYPHIIPGMWYPGTATKSCAASYRWYRDVLGEHEMVIAKDQGGDAYSLMSDAAAKTPPGSGNLFFHPYLLGEITPYLDNTLKGSFTGVSAFHTKAHFSRAVLEGVAYSLYDTLQVLYDLNIDIKQASIIGGGAKSPLWRQIVADVFGIELIKAQTDDSSLGSAMMAGVATGIFSSFEESVEKCVKVQEVVKPDPGNHRVYQKGFATYKKIHDALAPIYAGLAE